MRPPNLLGQAAQPLAFLLRLAAEMLDPSADTPSDQPESKKAEPEEDAGDGEDEDEDGGLIDGDDDGQPNRVMISARAARMVAK